jgi:hypothetical protein
MTYIALPATRRQIQNPGVVVLIVLALASAVIGMSNPEAITAEHQMTAIVPAEL